ncbi:winged helix-turn-helix transcriptional regulator [Brevibacillus porteri]|uniref:winged helix-turn-helix transcriptional regulator n=1 Tax=Brevibacillus porteri TaxID=2126350 RepID=UPI00362EF3B4
MEFITYKTLSSQLKNWKKMVCRHGKYPQVPPKVEYSLTHKAETLLPVLEELCEWRAKNQNR